MGKLDGKVAIVTGSGRAIGAEIAVKLAADGAAVVVNDLDEEPAKETVAAIESAGGKAVACPGSVAEAGFAERFAQDTAEVSFTEVRVPAANLLGTEGEGFYGLTRNLPQERVAIAVTALAQPLPRWKRP